MSDGVTQSGALPLSQSVKAVCPKCGREENIKGYIESKAWLYQHVAVEHGDELPDFEGQP